MAFNRTTNVSGTVVLNDITVNISFNYSSSSIPTSVNFSFTTSDNISVSGTCDENKIVNYYVNGGTVSDDLLILVEDKCKETLENYETV